MRIAQIAPLAEAVPPKLYGGTERVVSWLTEALADDGHEVTLFASGDSITSAKLVECAPQGLRLAGIKCALSSHLAMLLDLRRAAGEFDLLHFHIDLLPHALFHDVAHKCVTTLHGRLDLPDYHPIYRALPYMPLVSISDSQREPMPPGLNWAATVYHGLPPSLVPFQQGKDGYLAFLGRISPEKRPDRAIEIAKLAGIPLKIAAKVDPADRLYFEEEIEPLLDHPMIEFIGEINDGQKAAFLGNARALLFPIDWREPFGLVMIEAMSAGTPVIAWRNGSVAEVIDDGQSGFIVDSMEEAVAAVGRVSSLKRSAVRKCFERRFTVSRMRDDYVSLYEKLLSTPQKHTYSGFEVGRSLTPPRLPAEDYASGSHNGSIAAPIWTSNGLIP